MLKEQVVNSSFLLNESALEGGAVFLWRQVGSGPNPGRLDFTNCLFQANHSNGSTKGGALSLGQDSGPYAAGNARLVNCTLASNYLDVSPCTVSGQAVFVSSSSLCEITNSILYFNYLASSCPPPPLLPASPILGPATVSWSDVENGWGGAGSFNIQSDPKFRALVSGGLTLMAGSDCIDHANYSALPTDDLDVDNNGITTGEIIPIGLDGVTRFFDRFPEPNNGAPSLANWLDMGAYEKKP